MYQRSGGYASIRSEAQQQLPPNIAKTEAVIKVGSNMMEYSTLTTAGGGAAKTTLTKKLVLTLLVLVQICFISCLWLLQLGGDLSTNVKELTGQADSVRTKGAGDAKPHTIPLHGEVSGVNFITKAATAGQTAPVDSAEVDKNVVMNGTGTSPSSGQSGQVSSNFKKDFYLKMYRLNTTTIELRNGNGSSVSDALLWCFREGSIDEASQLTNDETAQNNAVSWEEDGERGEDNQCKCRAGWHGRDCGQPEVIWRALLPAKSRFQLQQPTNSKSTNTKQLIYLIEGNFFNLDLLDLQISMLVDIVDYFVIFVRARAQKDIKLVAHWLKGRLSSRNYVLYYCEETTQSMNCSITQAYGYFRHHLEQKRSSLRRALQPSDLLLYTNDCVLPTPQALRFLKYYATDVPNIPFRLKYVVYGFYWQHPKQTQLYGLISSFVHVDNTPSHIAVGDLAQLMQRALAPEGSHVPPFVIGDLNHFGGWYCKYCLQPEDIIAALHAESSAVRQVQFPAAVRGRNIDVGYLQKLIANGIYVDGKTQLLRNRRNSDQYYAPAIVDVDKAKYANFLVNLYETFDDDIEYEDGSY